MGGALLIRMDRQKITYPTLWTKSQPGLYLFISGEGNRSKGIFLTSLSENQLMAKILSYLGRYVSLENPLNTIEVFRGFESTSVTISDLGTTQFEEVLKTSEQDIFDEGVWVRCLNKAEIDFRKNGLILKKPDGTIVEYKKK
jgi:hypothetical protein